MANTSKRSRRPDGLYKASVTVGRNPNGTPKKKYFYAKTIKELDRQTAEYRLQMVHGTLSANESSSFGELAAVWLRDYKPLIGDRQRQTYTGIVKNHLAELSAIKLKDLKPAYMQGIINRLAEKGYAEKTLKEIRLTANQIMDVALQNDLIFRNPFAKVTVPKIEAEERLPITEEQKKLLIQTWKGHRMGIAALIMLFCGLRRGEMIALTWRDIDPDAKQLTVSKAAEFATNDARLKEPKTAAGSRIIPIPDSIIPALRTARAAASSSLMVCPAVKTGGIMSLTAWHCAWNSYQHFLNMQAGGKDASRSRPRVVAIEPFTAHQLRHTYATMLYDAGVDVKSAQYLLGHADIQVTLKIYTHLSETKKQHSIDALNDLISAEVAPLIGTNLK